MLGTSLAQLASRARDQLLLTGLVFDVGGGIVSAVIDNIPFTVTMIRLFGLGGRRHPGYLCGGRWRSAWGWAVTAHIGATANLIAVAEAEQCGIRGASPPLAWMRIGVPPRWSVC